MGEELEVRRATLSEIIDLRHRVLRAGLPRATAIFNGDDLPSSRHFGAFISRDGHTQAIGCASFHFNSWEGSPAWQLRGMATADGYRGRGIGRAMLKLAERDLLADIASPRLWWCNARVPAIAFYHGVGWKVVSEHFEIPTAGPHVRMLRREFTL